MQAVATWSPLPGGLTAAFVTLILANIGATVTPWMIFFQQSAVVDKGLTTADLAQGRLDTAIGASLAAVAAIATLIAASPLIVPHVDASNFASGVDFATALRPLRGNLGHGGGTRNRPAGSRRASCIRHPMSSPRPYGLAPPRLSRNALLLGLQSMNKGVADDRDSDDDIHAQ